MAKAKVDFFKMGLKAFEKAKQAYEFESGYVTTDADLKKLLVAPTGDIAYQACTNDVIKKVYDLSRLMRMKLIPAEWKNRKGMYEWMIALGKQTWRESFNAKTNAAEWGPVRAAGETDADYQNRRGMAARNALHRVQAIAELLWALEELFAEMQLGDEVARAAGVVGGLTSGSPGLACGDLVRKMGKEAKDAEAVVNKILESLNGVQTRLESVNNDALSRWNQLMGSKDKRATTAKLGAK